eukprot:scaffold11242_cov106-Cylindrotheca_fusiformis.AAC.6
MPIQAKRAPKPEIDLKSRLCFYRTKDNASILWPAVSFDSFDEYMKYFQDEIDMNLRTKIAIEWFDVLKGIKGMSTILRTLGKPVAEYVEVENDTPEVLYYLDVLEHVVSSQAYDPKAFASNDEYLEFMKALSESEEIFRGACPSENSFYNIGLQKVTEVNEGNVAGSDREMEDASLQNPLVEQQETPADHDMQDLASCDEAKSPTEPRDVEQAVAAEQPAPPAELPPSSTDASPIMTEMNNYPRANDATPRTRNQSSSSATVVSTDTSTCDQSSPKSDNRWPFGDCDPDVNECMSADEIGFAMVMAGMNRLKSRDGEKLFLFPNVTLEASIRGETSFSLEELVAFVKARNYFQNTNRDLFSAVSNSPQNKGPSPEPSPVKRTPNKKMATRKGTNAKRAISKKSTYTKTPPKMRTRFSPRRTRTNKPRQKFLPSDPFYEFSRLIKVLKNSMGWKYCNGDLYSNWLYIRGDSELGRYGELNVDFFREDEDVVKYCVKHNYKQKYHDLLEEAARNEAANFVTPRRGLHR